jgi:hypothetical protein
MMEPKVTSPFEVFWQTGDLDEWVASFAEDIVLHSPILSSPFEGRETAGQLYEALLEALTDVEITERFSGPTGDVFLWHAMSATRPVEGLDVVRLDSNGRVAEITVMMRPFPGIAAFVAGAAEPMARRRRPALRRVARPIGAALIPLFALLDRVGAAMAGLPYRPRPRRA